MLSQMYQELETWDISKALSMLNLEIGASVTNFAWITFASFLLKYLGLFFQIDWI